MYQKENHEAELYPVTASTTVSQDATTRKEDARDRMIAARREQQRLSIVRRLSMSGMLYLA